MLCGLLFGRNMLCGLLSKLNFVWHCSGVYIKAFSKVTPHTIRQVKASNIGQLVKISGIVTRCSDVKPLMQVAVYTCEECGFEIYQVFDLFSGFVFLTKISFFRVLWGVSLRG
jgi:DNA replicative helicase MCM subunit Mcm2 (Cdc46/Mcm family)